MYHAIIISGPTASGKSDFAIKIAQEIGGEIINADIGSMYTPLTIGTAKPDRYKLEVVIGKDRQKQPILHHLFDILDKPENFTVVQFRNRLAVLIDQILARGHVPIIVGGSAFYIKSFFFKQHEIVDTKDFVLEFERKIEQGLTDSFRLWQDLSEIDILRASQIHSHDTYRIVRALAIFKATGQKPSHFEQIFAPLVPFYFITCMRDRFALYSRIDARVHEMMNQGWLEEVKMLQGTDWEKFLLLKKLIGYDDLLRYLKNPEKTNLEDVTSLIAQKTRNYAKRQIIFLNKLQKDVERELIVSKFVGKVQDLNLTYCDVGLYIKGLSNRILQTVS